MIRPNRIAVAAFAVVAGMGNLAWAQPAAQRVEVTGSNIKRLSTETASPVEVIRRADIQQTGANTVRQVLDTITAAAGTELRDDGSSTGFASGASGVSMRSLGKGATLVLLNGRRIANYGLADGAQYTFVNIDAIPADVIDRIEILKDGASAVYGSDAMAGVINIITRSSYNGVGVSASHQFGIGPRVGNQTTAGVVAGFGDLGKDGFNVLGNIEFYKRDGYMLSDIISDYPEWHKRIVSPAFGDPSLVSYPGNIINGTARIAHPDCLASQKNTAGACTTNLNAVNQFSDPAERVAGYFSGKLRLGSIEAFAEATYAKTQTDYLALPFGINAPTTAFRWFDGNARKVQIVNKPMLPTTHPLNTFGRPVGLEYRFMDPGLDWEAPSYATQHSLLVGLKGSAGNWDWETAVGRLGSEATKESLAPYSDVFIDAIETNKYKVFGANDPALLKSMFRSAAINGENSTTFVDAKMTGELLKLPAGSLQAAVGVELRRESVYIKSVDDVMNAKLIGRGALWVEGKRDIKAVFAEVDAPLMKGLIANAAVRYDKTDGFAGRASPKFGLRWEATPQLLLRGTAAAGFRAPNVPEVLGKIGVTGFFNGTLDPKRCDTATAVRDILRTGDANDRAEATNAYNSGCSASVPAMISSNPNLKPELSKSLTLGFVFEPVRDLSIAVDYFRIERRDEITYRDPDYVLAREDQAAYKDLIARLPISGQDQIWVDRANQLSPGANLAWSQGQLVTLLLQYENFGKTRTSGVDIDVKSRTNLGDGGVLRLGFQGTYAIELREWDIDAGKFRPNKVGLRGGANTSANVPRWRAIFSGSLERGPWTWGLRLNYTSARALNNDETDAATWAAAGCAARLTTRGDVPCDEPETLIATASIAYTGIKNTRLTAIIGNALGESGRTSLRDGYAIRPTTVKLGVEHKF